MPNIIVIGASAGGLDPLKTILNPLPADFQAAIFVVMHLSPLAPSALPEILTRAASMEVVAPVDGEQIKPKRVYVAPPDRHLLVEPGRIRLTRGPRENRHRPAIDVLFRTAARADGHRVVGLILTGLMVDGAGGLHVIKSEGGIAIVQDPRDAMFAMMPESALGTGVVDIVLPASAMPAKIMELVREPWKDKETSRAESVAEEVPTPEGEKMREE